MRIFRVKTTQLTKNNGFTLIEILIALLIGGAIMTLTTITANNVFKTKVKSSARKIAMAIQFIYNEAAIKHKLHRMVFNFDKKEFFVEESQGKQSTVKIEETDEHNEDNDKNKQDAKNSFKAHEGNIGVPTTLPDGVSFKGIYKYLEKKEYKEGLCYLYFFPHGQVEKALILLQVDDEETVYSITINPLNGKAMVEDREIEIEDDKKI